MLSDKTLMTMERLANVERKSAKSSIHKLVSEIRRLKQEKTPMENHMINPPDYFFQDPPEEEEESRMDSTLTVGEPTQRRVKLRTPIWVVSVCDELGNEVFEVTGCYPKEVRRKAILMASAETMYACLHECLEKLERKPHCARIVKRVKDTLAEASGTYCEACEELGQPSRMVFSPTGRAYHADCVPASVKAEIAAMDKAASEDDCGF